MPKRGFPPEEVEPWRDWYGKPGRKAIPIPKDVTPTTMLRLAVAAKVAFPDGSMSVSALRREGAAKRLTIYRIRGKDFTTLADINLMKEAAASCREQAKVRDSISSEQKTGNPSGLSETGRRTSALDALRATALALSESLASTSQPSTTPEQAGAAVIPMRSK